MIISASVPFEISHVLSNAARTCVRLSPWGDIEDEEEWHAVVRRDLRRELERSTSGTGNLCPTPCLSFLQIFRLSHSVAPEISVW